MEELYTEDDLEGLDERVADLADEYDLTDTAREVMYSTWETVLTSNSYGIESVDDSQLEEHASRAPSEVSVPVQGDGEIYVDLTEEDGNWMNNEPEERTPLGERTDEEVQAMATEVNLKLVRLGQENAHNLDLALGELE